jgi:hypothetical protein
MKLRPSLLAINAVQSTLPQLNYDAKRINLAMIRLYARAPRGERAEGHKPFNPGERLTMIGTLGISGVTVAMVLEGAIDGETFTGFLRQVGGLYFVRAIG